jgi:tyrosine-protein kinase Etk/Wzc
MNVNNQDNLSDNLNSYKERLTSFSNNFEIGTIVFLFRKSLILFLLFFIISIVLAFLYIRYTPPIYESTSVIQLNVSNQAKSLLNIYSDFSEGGELNSEIELMRSPLLIKKTIANLDLNVGYFTQGNILEHNKYGQNSFKIYDIEILDSSIIGKKLFLQQNFNK